jgi:type II secretory pathway component PulF
MSEPAMEQGNAARTKEIRWFQIGTNAVILFALSAINIFLLLVIVPKFEPIYAEALPGMRLPSVTEFITTWKIAIAVITACWPILGTVLVRRRNSYATRCVNIGIVGMLLQVVITVIAVFMPMCGGLVIGLSEGK